MGHWVQVQTLVFQTKVIPSTSSGASSSTFLKTALIPVDVSGNFKMRHQTLPLLAIIFLLGCGQQPNSQSVSSKQIQEQHKKIKSKTTLEYFSDKINYDSESIQKKTVELFDTNGVCTDRTIYNETEKEILVEHFYFEWKNDTMFKYWMSIQDEDLLSLQLSAKETYLHNLKIAIWSANKGYVSYLLDGDEASNSTFGTQSEKLLYYSENGKLIKTKYSSQDGNWITTDYIYKGDTLIKMIKASIGGTCSQEYFYDNKGRKIKQSGGCFYSNKGRKTKLYDQWYYRYNDRDSLISSSHYYNNKLRLKYEYQYNSDGNVVLENVYDDFKNGDTTKISVFTEYYYNSSKQLAQATTYFNNTGHPVSMEYYKYDSLNNLIEKRKFVNMGSTNEKSYFDRRTTQYKYEYY